MISTRNLLELLDRSEDDFLKAWQRLTPSQRIGFSAEIQRRKVLAKDPTPGIFASRLDPLTVQTKALDIVDEALLQIRDRVEVMFARREIFSNYRREGKSEEEAIELAQAEVPDAGLDRLIVSMPPQEGKTSRITVYGVLWLLRQFPTLRIAIVSYDGQNASRMTYAMRSLIEQYDGSEGNPDLGLRLAKDQKAVSRWTLDQGGGVYGIGIGGGLTGRPVDLMIVDDPVKDYRAAESILQSGQAWDWWQTVGRTRLAPWAPTALTLTRWHELDLAGRAEIKQLEDEAKGLTNFDRWHIINIPAQADYDPNKGETDILGRMPGEFMASARGRTRDQWEATKNATAPKFWWSLYQGKPTPDSGEVWERQWWRRYSELLWRQDADGTYRLDGFDRVIQSWDCAFRDTNSSDFVVGQVWAKKGAQSFLVYQVCARMSFTVTLDAIRRVTRLFPQAHKKVIEAKANGDAVLDTLKLEIAGMVPANPTTSKTGRAIAVSPFINAGNVLLPTNEVVTAQREIAWDVDGFIAEASAFPNGAHDDQVDATSQALAELYLEGSGIGEFLTPTGSLDRRGSIARQGATLSPFQRRLTQAQLRR